MNLEVHSERSMSTSKPKPQPGGSKFVPLMVTKNYNFANPL